MITIQERRIALHDGGNERITVPPQAELLIVDTSVGTHAVHLAIGEGATVTYCSLTRGKATREAVLARDASIRWVDMAHGDDIAVHAITRLAGEGAHAEFASVLLGTGASRSAVTSDMIHEASHTTSDMLTRAVMLGKSRGAYAGLIRIDERAKGCDAYQKQETILLSNEARMDAEPNLEIKNPDVRCTHGVSLGRIDAEKLFYLASRGIPRETAISLIVHGFFDAIIARLGPLEDEAAAIIREAI